MKLFKKAAALFFCLALALSVMAVTALAVDGDGGYSVTLTPTNTAIKDQDNDNKYEIAKGDTENVTYNIVLNNNTANSQKINAFRFKLTSVPTGLVPTVKYASGQTQKPTGGWYVFDPKEDGSEDITMDAAAVTIGTITFDVTNDLVEGFAEGTPLTFTVDNIQLSERATTDNAAINYNLAALLVSDLEAVSSTYTITLKTKTSNTAGTITDGSDGTVTYSFLNGVTLPEAANVWGYDFNNWSVTNTNYGWSATYADEATIPATARNIGNVELQSTYDIVTYTITYNYKESVTAPDASAATMYDYSAKVGNTTDIKTTYTIEQLASNATADFLNLDNMTRKGYTLTGWTAEAGTGTVSVNGTTRDLKTDEYSTAIWSALTANSTVTTGLVGAYGNVVITPHWAIDGKQARDTYAFAYYNTTDNSGNELVLFAVPTANVGGKYYCRFSGTDYEMFTVVESGATVDSQFKYKESFVASRDVGGTSKDTGNDALEANETYTVYASIIPASNETPTFIVDESASATSVSYTGSIFFNDQTPTAADYGNVNTMLGNSATLNTSVTTQQRLSADRDGDDGVNTGYGSILDVRAIINQMA